MSEQQQQWKDEALQLKKDLDSRPKQIVKREVAIQFGGVKQPPESESKNHADANSKAKHAGPKRTDDFLKRQLGLT